MDNKKKENEKRQIVTNLLGREDCLPPDRLINSICPACGAKGAISLEEEHEMTIELNDDITTSVIKVKAYICDNCEWTSFPEESMRDIILAEDGRSYIYISKEAGVMRKNILH